MTQIIKRVLRNFNVPEIDIQFLELFSIRAINNFQHFLETMCISQFAETCKAILHTETGEVAVKLMNGIFMTIKILLNTIQIKFRITEILVRNLYFSEVHIQSWNTRKCKYFTIDKALENNVIFPPLFLLKIFKKVETKDQTHHNMFRLIISNSLCVTFLTLISYNFVGKCNIYRKQYLEEIISNAVIQ